MGHRNIFEVTGLLPEYKARALETDHDEQLSVFKSLRFHAIDPQFCQKPLTRVCHRCKIET